MPKARTLTQNFGVHDDSEKTLRKNHGEVARADIVFRLESNAWSVVLVVVSCGDRRVGVYWMKVAADSDAGLAAIRRAFKRLKGEVPPLEHYAYSDWAIGDVLQWGHIAAVISPQVPVSAR